ncbi:MAG TPA: M14 metallopeptidase family protein [Vicinamibacterales bacterium]|nr:M14 metallopeptidase family protein [Vicinamibacterales bacterium]
MPHPVRRTRGPLALAVLLLVSPIFAAPAKTITTPKQQFGHDIGDDYFLATYTQLTEYWKKLATESDRMKLVSIGKTAEGRDQYMAIISAPENIKNLEKYREISKRLAMAQGLTDDQAHALARDGKAVVWIDGGLHATEVLGAHQLMEQVYQLVSQSDEETQRFLRDIVILCTQVNPDGMELVSNWYMRESDPKKRSTSGVPRLWQKYVGHDNNRDFYMMNQPESTNINKVLYREWFPQIVYNHHQSGPTGTVMFSPPFRDPFNYVYDPIVVNELDQVGAAMHSRFDAEGKPGVTTRSGANYSTWWNGGLRTMPYFHNEIGLLTETIGNPTPETIGFVPDRMIAKGDFPYPIAPQVWHFRQSIDYSITANHAVLDFASRYREELLYNFYLMGRNSIRKGSTDTWTNYPTRVAKVKAEIAKDEGTSDSGDARMVSGGFLKVEPTKYYDLLRKPEYRDPRGYVIPSDQPDFLTAIKFANILIKAGVTVDRATAPFTAAGKQYPAGSLVVKTAQAFRPHVLDMFEPQDHPNDFQYPGGPPIPPYDNAGYTPAFQMGVKVDRILDGFDGPFEAVPDVIKPAPGKITDTAGAAGFIVSQHVNDAVIAVNRLLKAGEDVYWVKDRTWHSADGSGVIFVAAKPTTLPILQKAAADVGLSFSGVTERPSGLMQLHPVRIGLWDQYGGSMPSGWVRWLMEQYEFPYELVFPQALDAGNLRAKFDAIVLPDGAVREPGSGGRGGEGGNQPKAADIPAEWRDRLGHITAEKTLPQFKKFVDDGGTIVAWGSSASLGEMLGLPLGNHLVEMVNGAERRLPTTKFYIPGSILRVAVDNTDPIAFGMEKQLDVFFNNNPVLELAPNASLEGVRPVAWFDSREPLRSGWAWGQAYLQGGAAAVEAHLGKGKMLLFGPEITFRGQPHGTFKFLFNSLYYATAQVPAGAVTSAAQPERRIRD